MSPEKIKRIELTVHLFHEINFSIKYPYTKYNPKYTPEHERIMKEKYLQKVDKVANDPGRYLLFVAHTPINKGILHENVYEIYMNIIDKISDRHTAFDFSVEPRALESLLAKTDKDTTITAWGEYTSGCVLNDLLRTKEKLGMKLCPEQTLNELNPEIGIDFTYPRPWEISDFDYKTNKEQIKNYRENVYHNFEYYFGKKEMPRFG
ncbi:MAG: hypothetical protein ACOCZQ_02455 [Nanoarchaeota archaeon]